MSLNRGNRHSSSDEWAEAIAGDLVEQLDSFAFEREKVIEKLDIRAAKTARGLSMELSTIRRALGSMPRDLGDPRTDTLLSFFRDLRGRAQALLAGDPIAEEPPRPVAETGPRLRMTPDPASESTVDDDRDLDEVTAARTPESLRTATRKP